MSGCWVLISVSLRRTLFCFQVVEEVIIIRRRFISKAKFQQIQSMSLISWAKTLANRLRATTYVTATQGHHDTGPRLKSKGEYVPVYVVLGLILVSLSFGAHTAKQQLMHSPTVRVKKSRRETVPEVTDPDRVTEESKKFLSRGFFRRVAHVQDTNTGEHEVLDPIMKNVYAHRQRVDTLKPVGVDPKAA